MLKQMSVVGLKMLTRRGHEYQFTFGRRANELLRTVENSAALLLLIIITLWFRI
jgi:hypothetical protein